MDNRHLKIRDHRYYEAQLQMFRWIRSHSGKDAGMDVLVGKTTYSVAGGSWSGATRGAMIIEPSDFDDKLMMAAVRRTSNRFNYSYVMIVEEAGRESPIRIPDRLPQIMGIMIPGSHYPQLLRRCKSSPKGKNILNTDQLTPCIQFSNEENVLKLIGEKANSGGLVSKFAINTYKDKAATLIRRAQYDKDRITEANSQSNAFYHLLCRVIGRKMMGAIRNMPSIQKLIWKDSNGYESVNELEVSMKNFELVMKLAKKEVLRRDRTCRACPESKGPSWSRVNWLNPNHQCFRCKKMPEIREDLKQASATNYRRSYKGEKRRRTGYY